MDSDGIEKEDQEGMVKKDIRNLTKVLTTDNLDPAIMFAKKRSIRSFAPDLERASGTGKDVADRLKRVPLPDPKE